jgi:crotonobetainyl-CoA:carnitine CoA-transferase CaiB-like acyl-CoA transferase
MTKDEAVEILLELDVPCGPVQTVEELVEDEHLAHREMVKMRPNKGEGRNDVPVPGMPIKYGESPDPEINESPRLGEHSEAILRETLGYDDDRINDLRDGGIIDKSQS